MAQTLTQAPADSQLVTLKVPPHSIEAEQSVLGGLLLDNQASTGSPTSSRSTTSTATTIAASTATSRG